MVRLETACLRLVRSTFQPLPCLLIRAASLGPIQASEAHKVLPGDQQEKDQLTV